MPGLIRGVARTAVVAGTATAVSNRVSRRQRGRWAAQEPQYQPQPQYEPQPYQAQPQYQPAPPPSQASGPAGMDDKIAQLKELGELRAAGVLTDAEFEGQKAKILGG